MHARTYPEKTLGPKSVIFRSIQLSFNSFQPFRNFVHFFTQNLQLNLRRSIQVSQIIVEIQKMRRPRSSNLVKN